MLNESKHYIFYDGDCGFCNFWVQWILENDQNDQFLFSSLQSNFGQTFLKERGLEAKQFNTLYIWKPKKFYLVKSEAVLKIAKILGGKYYFISIFTIFPKFFSDGVYDFIARNRTKLASQKCFIPNTEQRKKFVE